MKVFCDTSVLIASCMREHPHHVPARRAFDRVAEGQDEGHIGAHSIAEVYNTLTRLPFVPRIHPSEAERLIDETLLPVFNVITLTVADYRGVLHSIAAGGYIGAKIYDALLLHCAAKSAAERIYTFNLADFQSLAPEDVRQRICAP